METPSSTTRRVTRSTTTLAASNNTVNSSSSSSNNNNIPVSGKIEDSEKNLSKARQRNGQQQQDRSAMVDITNDSPIVGLANGNSGDLETPLSSIAKQRGSRVKNTPGSGEALLRGQVKTLLMKVEEEAEIPKLSMEIRPFLQLVNSPVGLLAPTPANTPQILNLSGDGGLNNSGTGLASLSPSLVVEEQLISRVVNQIFDGKNKENPESEMNPKLSMEIRPFLQLVNSPVGLLAPTPANTPQILNLSGDGGLNNSGTGLASLSPSLVVEEQLISRVVNQIFDGKNKENPESEMSLIGRSLLLDFSDKSEVSKFTSELTYQEVVQGGSNSSGYKEEKPQGSTDDDASIWSMQVNASTNDEDDGDEERAEKEEEDYYEDVEEEEEYDDGGLLVDKLCAGLNNINVNERVAPKFAGKHTRFVYNSDDELVEEVVAEYCAEITSASSSNILRLKGLPTPKGKHLRFPEEEEKSAL